MIGYLMQCGNSYALTSSSTAPRDWTMLGALDLDIKPIENPTVWVEKTSGVYLKNSLDSAVDLVDGTVPKNARNIHLVYEVLE